MPHRLTECVCARACVCTVQMNVFLTQSQLERRAEALDKYNRQLAGEKTATNTTVAVAAARMKRRGAELPG
jgi:hypothetical protein